MGILPEAECSFWALTYEFSGFHACHSRASRKIPARRLVDIRLNAAIYLQTCVTIQYYSERNLVPPVHYIDTRVDVGIFQLQLEARSLIIQDLHPSIRQTVYYEMTLELDLICMELSQISPAT